MEFTEDMLVRIADNLADLRLRVSLMGQIIAQHHPESEEFEEIVKQAIETPDFQQFRAQVLEQLKGGH
jgi:hypothetical protein